MTYVKMTIESGDVKFRDDNGDPCDVFWTQASDYLTFLDELLGGSTETVTVSFEFIESDLSWPEFCAEQEIELE